MTSLLVAWKRPTQPHSSIAINCQQRIPWVSATANRDSRSAEAGGSVLDRQVVFNIGSALCGTDANYRSTKVSVFSASINNEEGQRYALAKFEPGVTLWWAYAVTTSSRDARERSIELAGSI